MKKFFIIFLPARLHFMFLLAGGFAPAFLFAQNTETGTEKGTHFEHTTFSEILAKAKKENKMVMVDAYTTWCGPCKWMAKNIFPNDTVGEFYNKNFINAKIDMEKGEGIDLAKKYQVSCYPTYLFIDGKGELVHRGSSAMPAQQFIALGMNAMNPAKQFSTYKTNYNVGSLSPNEIAEYILMKGGTCMPVKDEIVKYFTTQKESDLTNYSNWLIFFKCRMDISTNSREFRYLVDHRVEYEKRYKPEEVARLIEDCYSFGLGNYIKDKNTEEYKKLKTEIINKNLPFSEKMVLNADMALYKSNKDWNNYALVAENYVAKYVMDNSGSLNSIAWAFYENIEDKTKLEKAVAWAKRSVELEPGYANWDTYSALLYKLGKKTEAQAAAEKAIELGKKEDEDVTSTQELLDKINRMK